MGEDGQARRRQKRPPEGRPLSPDRGERGLGAGGPSPKERGDGAHERRPRQTAGRVSGQGREHINISTGRKPGTGLTRRGLSGERQRRHDRLTREPMKEPVGRPRAKRAEQERVDHAPTGAKEPRRGQRIAQPIPPRRATTPRAAESGERP